jgi:hypothetical protein
MIIKTIRTAIEESGKSRNQISLDTGIDNAVLSRIVNGGSCSIETADKLFEYLGLKIKSPKKTKKESIMKNRAPFRKNCNIQLAEELCKQAIDFGRGVMVSRQILKELPYVSLDNDTKNWLAKWVNPRRTEKVQPIFQNLSLELFGKRISRND